MQPFLNKTDAIVNLHERGFTEDFKLFGNDLLWIQEKIFFRPGQFRITEVHRFLEPSRNEAVVFAIIATGIKGILLNHYKSYTDKIPAVINRELINMSSNLLNQPYDYVDVIFYRE